MRIVSTAILLAALTFTAAAQDWYHQREQRFRGEQWHRQVFLQIRTDLDHVRSAWRAAPREQRRIERTREELTKMQADWDAGRWDNGLVNDVIDSLRKSANDDRLAPRDRSVLADDVMRLKDFQEHHNSWRR